MVPKLTGVNKERAIREGLLELAVSAGEKISPLVTQNPELLCRAEKLLPGCGSLDRAVKQVSRCDKVMREARASGIDTRNYRAVFYENNPYLVPKELGQECNPTDLSAEFDWKEVEGIRVVEAPKKMFMDYLVYAVGPRIDKPTEEGVKSRYSCIRIKGFDDSSLPASAAFNVRAKATNAAEEVAHKITHGFGVDTYRTVISANDWQHFGLVGIVLRDERTGNKISTFVNGHFVILPNNGKRVYIGPDCLSLGDSGVREVLFSDLSAEEMRKLNNELYGAHKDNPRRSATHPPYEHMASTSSSP